MFLFLVRNYLSTQKIDIDMKYDYDTELDEEEQIKHNINQISKMIANIYINELRKYLKIDEEVLKSLRFYLTERKTGYIVDKPTGKIIKDGIHIPVPDFLIDNCILHKVRENVLKNPNLLNSLKQ